MSDKVLFRASGVGNLISLREPKGGELSVTAKRFIEEMWRQNKFGYREIVKSKYMNKGTQMEENSINLFSAVSGNYYTKNTERKSNKVLTGECDLFSSTHVVDIKTSWSLKTFMEAEMSIVYEYQLRSYMELWGLDEAILAFCLVDATEDMIMNEQQRLFFDYNKIDTEFEQDDDMLKSYEEECEQIRRNLFISDRIPPEQRVKQFHITRDEEKTNKLYDQIAKAIEYYKSLKLV